MKRASSPVRPHRFGLFARINLAIVLIVTVVLVLATLLLIASSTRPILERDRLLNEEAAGKLRGVVEEKYNLVYNQSNLLLSSGHIGYKLAGEAVRPGSIYQYENTKVVTDYLTALLYSDTDILDAAVLSADGKANFARSSASGRTMNPGYDYFSLPELRSLLQSERNIEMYHVSSPPYLLRAGGEVVTFAAKIYNPLTLPRKNIVGVLLINYPVSVFGDAYRQLGSISGGRAYVLSSDSTVVFSSDDALCGKAYSEITEEAGSEVASQPVGISGIRVVSVVARDALRSASNRLMLTMLLILIPSIILVLLVVLFLNRHYQKRLNGLADAMEGIAVRGLDVRLPAEGNDEIARLSRQFNRMCENLDAYIKLHYRAEVARKTAELNALQAQINPHFLFNTIESIRMRASDEGDVLVADMLVKLGNLFRWMTMMDRQIVYLEDEIEYNESYLSLQKLRYEDSFEARIDIPDSALYLGVPKFTLQPIVENALRHGLQSNGLAGVVTVRASVEDGVLTLAVSDDGSGMDEAELARLRAHISGEHAAEGFGIGLQNVQSRIRMLFGERYGLTVKSEKGAGTTVTVALPAMPEKEMEHDVSNATRG